MYSGTLKRVPFQPDSSAFRHAEAREEYVKALREGKTDLPAAQEKPVMVIKVGGMMCNHCKMTVENACKAVLGVTDAVVDLEAKTVTVTGTADLDALKKAIVEEDFEILD